MKIQNKKVFIAFIVTTIIAIVLGCNFDYQCGKGYPFAACDGNLNIYPGISFDYHNFNILIAGKYNSTHNGPFGLPSMNGLKIDTENATLEHLFDIHGEIEDGAGANHIYKFIDFVPNSKYYYFIMNQAGQPIFSILKSETSEIQSIWNIHNTPFVIDFVDSDSMKLSVFSGYGIYKLNKLPTQLGDREDNILLYQNQIVNGLAIDQRNPKDIYMSTYDGYFLKGTTDCLNCTQDQLIKLGQDDDAKSATDFIMVRGMIYFSYNGGIKKFSTDQSNDTTTSSNTTKTIQIVKNENVLALTEFNGIIYYLNDQNQVKSVLSDSDNLIRTIYNSTSDNLCQPAIGFDDLNGNCSNGTIIWDTTGLPRCVKFIQGTTVPELCYFQHHCSNSIYYACKQGTCQCLENFYGPDCSKCDGKIEYIYNGIPTCINRVKE